MKRQNHSAARSLASPALINTPASTSKQSRQLDQKDRYFALCRDATKQATNVASRHRMQQITDFPVATQQNTGEMLRRNHSIGRNTRVFRVSVVLVPRIQDHHIDINVKKLASLRAFFWLVSSVVYFPFGMINY